MSQIISTKVEFEIQLTVGRADFYTDVICIQMTVIDTVDGLIVPTFFELRAVKQFYFK